MAEGDLDIQLTEDTDPPKQPVAGGTVDPPKQPDAGDIDGGIAELQRKLDEAQAATAAAERRADEATQRARQIETGATGDRLAMVQSALDTIEANVVTLESQMADALAAGDFARHSQLNRQMSENLAQKPDLVRGKAALEQQARQPAAPQPGQLSDSQKIDLYVQNMQPRAAGWIRAHPQYVL